MGWLEGALRMFPSWTWDIGGHTVAWNVFVPALLVMGLLFGALGAWPFLERWATGDKSYHHVNVRPRNAPTRTAFGMAGVTFYGVLWLEGANDIIAVHLQIPLYTTTEISRYAIFIGPVIAFWVTRRICFGLQRRDAAMLTHGVETGIISQLPNGAFVEAERPLDRGRGRGPHRQAARPAARGPRGGRERRAGPALRGVRGRLQARVHEYFAEGSRWPRPPTGTATGNGLGGPARRGHRGRRRARDRRQRAGRGRGRPDRRGWRIARRTNHARRAATGGGHPARGAASRRSRAATAGSPDIRAMWVTNSVAVTSGGGQSCSGMYPTSARIGRRRAGSPGRGPGARLRPPSPARAKSAPPPARPHGPRVTAGPYARRPGPMPQA